MGIIYGPNNDFTYKFTVLKLGPNPHNRDFQKKKIKYLDANRVYFLSIL